MTLQYQNVSEYEFLTYIENIKNELKKVAPEWHVNVQHTATQILYHLARFDFTQGEDQRWPVGLNPFVFAYEQTQEGSPKLFFLLNQSPITKG